MARRLHLSKERLSELSSDDLAAMGGGMAQPTPPTPVPITYYCRPTLNVTQCVDVQSGKTACVTPILPTYYCTPMP